MAVIARVADDLVHAGLVFIELAQFLRAVQQHVEDTAAQQGNAPPTRHGHQSHGIDVLEQDLVVSVVREQAGLVRHAKS